MIRFVPRLVFGGVIGVRRAALLPCTMQYISLCARNKPLLSNTAGHNALSYGTCFPRLGYCNSSRYGQFLCCTLLLFCRERFYNGLRVSACSKPLLLLYPVLNFMKNSGERLLSIWRDSDFIRAIKPPLKSAKIKKPATNNKVNIFCLRIYLIEKWMR